MNVIIYSDGGSDPNPGIGGWAAILRSGKHEKVLTGNDPDTTNNRMELTAATEALKALKRPCKIDFFVDSEYVRKGITEWIGGWAKRGWMRKNGEPIPNADLWQELWPLTKEHTIQWHWVKGHSGNVYNERVDKLAREARLEITPGLEISDEIPRIYLRSSCRGNPGPGGWGAVLEFEGDTQQLSGNAHKTTNNRMEMMAAIEAFSLLPPGTPVQLFTTSDYLYQGATNWIFGWRKRDWKKRGGQPIANADLWQLLDEMMREYKVTWLNAKGKKEESLDVAGKLASEASRSLPED